MYKETLVKDLAKIGQINAAFRTMAPRAAAIGAAILFLVIAWFVATLASGGGANQNFVIAAGVIGAYMALNIGANDVANNVAPATRPAR